MEFHRSRKPVKNRRMTAQVGNAALATSIEGLRAATRYARTEAASSAVVSNNTVVQDCVKGG